MHFRVRVAPKGVAPNLPDKDNFGSVEQSLLFKSAATPSHRRSVHKGCSRSRALRFNFALTLKKTKKNKKNKFEW